MSFASRIALSFIGLSLFVGCTQSVETQPELETALLRADLSPPSPVTPPAVYNAYVGLIACVPLDTSAGRWTASLTFPESRAFCTYVWSGPGVADVAGLTAWLVARGVEETDISRDATCVDATCVRPLEKGMMGGGGAGGSACYKCIHAAILGDTVMVVLPPELVTADPSSVAIVFRGGAFKVEQPGGAAAFRVILEDVTVPLSGVAFTPGLAGSIGSTRSGLPQE